jgi:hypothetical protein
MSESPMKTETPSATSATSMTRDTANETLLAIRVLTVDDRYYRYDGARVPPFNRGRAG